VEPIIADGKDKHGLRRAQFRGRGNMHIQAVLTASVLNIKQLVRWGPVPQSGAAALTVVRPPVPPLLGAWQHLLRVLSELRALFLDRPAPSSPETALRPAFGLR